MLPVAVCSYRTGFGADSNSSKIEFARLIHSVNVGQWNFVSSESLYFPSFSGIFVANADPSIRSPWRLTSSKKEL
jgi:hypothetical protein